MYVWNSRSTAVLGFTQSCTRTPIPLNLSEPPALKTWTSDIECAIFEASCKWSGCSLCTTLIQNCPPITFPWFSLRMSWVLITYAQKPGNCRREIWNLMFVLERFLFSIFSFNTSLQHTDAPRPGGVAKTFKISPCIFFVHSLQQLTRKIYSKIPEKTVNGSKS